MDNKKIAYQRLGNIETFASLKLYKNVLTPLAYRYAQIRLKKLLKVNKRITFFDIEMILLDELPSLMDKRLTK